MTMLTIGAGNVDYVEWYTLNQVGMLHDTDKIMEAFFEFCHKAGPEKCAFYASSPAAIEKRYFDLLANLKEAPVLIPTLASGNGPSMPELVTYSKLLLLVRTCLYRPIHKFPPLAHAMAALEEGNGLPFYKMNNGDSDPPPQDFCTRNETLPSVPADISLSGDAHPAIMCSDGNPLPTTTEELILFAETLQNASRFAGSTSTHFKVACASRTARPRYSFRGPWSNVTTSFPILFIGNVADNVTPLQNAHANSARFPGSVVLTQRSYGHCSLAAPSTCSAKAIHAYFQDGTLPEPGTECPQDYELFEDPPPTVLGSDEHFSWATRGLSLKSKIGAGIL